MTAGDTTHRNTLLRSHDISYTSCVFMLSTSSLYNIRIIVDKMLRFVNETTSNVVPD